MAVEGKSLFVSLRRVVKQVNNVGDFGVVLLCVVHAMLRPCGAVVSEDARLLDLAVVRHQTRSTGDVFSPRHVLFLTQTDQYKTALLDEKSSS